MAGEKPIATLSKCRATTTIPYAAARDIMGEERFFGIEDWQKFYGWKPADSEVFKVSMVPLSEKILASLCSFYGGDTLTNETHILFLGLESLNGLPLNIEMWRKLQLNKDNGIRFWDYEHSRSFQRSLLRGALAGTTCRFRWYFMPLEIVPYSLGMTYEDQLKELVYGYEAPSAIEEITKTILYNCKNCINLNATRWARCRDIISAANSSRCREGGEDSHVCVGHTDGGWIHIDAFSDRGFSNVGLAASRKL